LAAPVCSRATSFSFASGVGALFRFLKPPCFVDRVDDDSVVCARNTNPPRTVRDFSSAVGGKRDFQIDNVKIGE